jgi:acetyl esterase/lipase
MTPFRRVFAGLIVAGPCLIGCVNTAAPPEPAQAATRGELVAAALRYATGRVLDVYRPPSAARSLPVIVLLHGCCGDRSDLTKLAESAAGQGAVVFNADWAGMGESARFPDGYEDAACAVRFARARGQAFGGDPSRVALGGWADGAMVAAVIAVRGDAVSPSKCSEPTGSVRPDALIGIGGFYGWSLPVGPDYVTARAVHYLGGDPHDVAETWRAATPYPWLREARPMRATLLVGAKDALRHDAERFANALRAASWSVRLVVLPNADAWSLLSPRSAAGRAAAAEIVLTLESHRAR